MDPDRALAEAVDAFCDALGPRVRDLAASVDGIDGEQVAADVQVEAYNLAAAFIDADGLHTDAELWSFLTTFGPRFGGSLAHATPTDVRTARLVAGRRSFLDEPSELLEVLLTADGRDGTSLASLYYDRALAIGFAIASLDQMASPVELAAIESFRGRILDRISEVRGVGRQQAAHDAAASGAGADAAEAPTADLPPARPVDEVLAELDSLIGLDAVKAEVKLVADLTRVQLLRAERGLPVLDQSRHLVFSGNPGTGKTTVARLLAEIYRSLGVVGRGHLVEVDRSGLVAGFVGQTAPKVVAAFDEADEGVLLIDEAYSLVRGSESDFGREAIDTIVKLVEDRRDRIVVIMAGYPDEMELLVSANPGLRSRFPKTIHFPDYTTEDLIAIFRMQCDKGGYIATDAAILAVREHLDALPRDKGFGNGRVSRNLFEAAVARQASRIVAIDHPTDVQLTELTAADIPPGIPPGIPAAIPSDDAPTGR